MAKHPRTWLVRAGKDATFIDDFRANSHVAIGWRETGPIQPTADDDSLTDLFDRTFASAKPGTRRMWQAQVRRFLTEMRPGDRVATYDPNSRVYLLGTVEGDVEWRDGPLPRVRAVRWTHHTLRDALSVDTRNGLGSIATFFRASQTASDELWSKAVTLDSAATVTAPPAPATTAQEDETQTAETILREEVREKAEQFIEDRIASLDWQQMQELVAGILRAMGYHATISAEGADRGVDIFASPDGLGLQEPRIFVEVKHRGGAMGADELRSFLGGRRAGDRCLYVSTGGFTKEARYEADRAVVPLTLITLPKLRELLLQHYEQLDPAARALVPLQRLYWPVE
jgi:restriction system protein